MTDDPQTEMNRKEDIIQFIKRLFVILSIGAGALFILIILMSFMFMLDPGAYEDKLVSGYAVVAGDTINDAAVQQTDAGQVIPPMVLAYGWNDDFIIAEQHPTLDGRTVDLYTKHWYLIEVHNGKVHGPLTEPQFTGLRSELGVPNELTFTKTIPPD
jgi:hypothetical protein